jgi:GNAT superfamily N-acetyltransferase
MAKIRTAFEHELELLGSIELDADLRYRETPSEHLSAAAPVFTPAVLHEHYWATGRLLIAEVDNAIVGFITWGFEGEHDYLCIDQVSVAREYGRRGIGAALMGSVLDIADERNLPTLLNTERTIPWNGPWYRRFGFVEVNPTDWTPWMDETARKQEAAGIFWTDRVWMIRSVPARD